MNNLFNEKILNKKAGEEVNLDKNNLRERRKYLDKWIDNLENGTLNNSKEEEFQGEFLHDIFTTVLNAVNKSDGKTEWNLQRETKTELDGQKADGVLGFFDNEKQDIRAVIELKGANVGLDVRQKRSGDNRTPVEQAFGYAPKYGKNCQWVIVSNYKEIRLYRSNDMMEYQSFFLKNLRDDLEFKKFIYILSFNALVGTKTKKAKTQELSEEYQKNQAEIEKKFYNEYKNIRLHIFENMKKNNPTVNENILIEKVQKLLDRFLFICFCEDKELLPSNVYHNMVEKGNILGDVFETFKMLCSWINIGNPKYNISKFNGGLFQNDEILDTLLVDDEVFREMEKIAEYDFSSELNENILGHIFEQSISDIEELKKISSGEEFDNKKSKRKKDGIFYTPKYITKYIVENSIKNWLDDKRKELGEEKLPKLKEKDYEIKYARKTQTRIFTENYKKHIEFWGNYRKSVRNIKIVDPACGSGAFLITAFEFLYSYNEYLDDKIFDLTGTRDLFSDISKDILQNNIFGVDLNKESVEITKLSLWLKTADKNKTLATLEDNIKCGNSLIDDKEIAGESAFNWEKEFPEIFKNGGFDVVVGNPPYVLCQPSNTNKKALEYYKKFNVASYKIDLFHLFFERGINLMANNGFLGFITPNTYLMNKYTKELRKFILENTDIKNLVNYNDVVFSEAGVNVATIILNKNKINGNKMDIYNSENAKLTLIDKKKQSDWENSNELSFNLNKDFIIDLEKCILLNEIASVTFGLQTKDKNKYVSNMKIEDDWEKCYTGKDISRYYLRHSTLFFKNNREEVKAGGSWDMNIHKSNKILVRQVGNPEPIFSFDNNGYCTLNTIYSIVIKNKKFDYLYLLSILNSKLMKKYWLSKYNDNKDLFPKIKGFQLKELPIREISLEAQQPFIEKADKMLFLNKELQELSYKFQRMTTRKFELEKLSTKLQDWHLLDFSDFVKELKKAKIKLSLSDEAEWEDYFLSEKEKAVKIREEINFIDNKIDKMVYELYGLSEEEIKVIEDN